MKCNDCDKCPCYENHCDYWGEYDESCLINCDFNNCHKPMIVRKILLFKVKLLYSYYNWRMERDYKKDLSKWEEEQEGIDENI